MGRALTVPGGFGVGANGGGAGQFVNLWLILENPFPADTVQAQANLIGTSPEVVVGGGGAAYASNPDPVQFQSSLYYQILPFIRDNEQPLEYSGSTVSQQEMSCYEISLLDLVVS